jgi:hypothetical protein
MPPQGRLTRLRRFSVRLTGRCAERSIAGPNTGTDYAERRPSVLRYTIIGDHASVVVRFDR